MNAADASGKKRNRTHKVEVRLENLQQFFNSMDPSPFYERDLDPDAEHFILSWTEEFPLHEPVRLVLYLAEDGGEKRQTDVEEAVHNHFRNQARLAQLEFRRLMRVGSRSLAIGLAILASCILAGRLLAGQDGPLGSLLRQSLLIGGWVAMWQPMQIYLYGWWPVRRRQRIYEKLGCMQVEISAEAKARAPHPASSR